MGKLKDSVYYHDAIHEINHSYGDFYLFDGFIVYEIHEGITLTWENYGKQLVEEIAYLYDSKGKDLVLISNRINSYAVKPTDWKKFYKHQYTMKAYGVVSYSKIGNSIARLEKLFNRIKSERFHSLDTAVEWAKGISSSQMVHNKVS